MSSFFKKINESLTQLETTEVNEMAGGVKGSLLRKAHNLVRRTNIGAGRRDLELKAKALNANWLQYRGQQKSIPNSHNIEAYVKNQLGMKTDEVWNTAIAAYEEDYPEAAKKYKEGTSLDRFEVLNFFVELVRARLAWNDEQLEQPQKQQNTTGQKQQKQQGWNQETPHQGPKPYRPRRSSSIPDSGPDQNPTS